MNRIAAHVFVALMLTSLAAVLMSVSAFAKENPGNHYGKDGNPGNHYGQISNPGHHYGRLKHQTPPPTPNPTPNPNPNPTPQPVTHPGSGDASSSTGYGSTPGLTSGLPDGADTSPIPVTVIVPAQNQASGRFAPQADAANGLDWLLLLILPALLAIWVVAGAGLVRNGARRMRISRAVTAPNPA